MDYFETLEKLKKNTASLLGSPMRTVESNNEMIENILDNSIQTYIFYSKKNKVDYNWIYLYSVAQFKETIGFIRSHFSGEINTGDNKLFMDYNHLFSTSSVEKNELITSLTRRKSILDWFKNLF